MFADKRKYILPSLIVAIILLTALLIPSLRIYMLDGLRLPLKFAYHINREIKGLVFYHRNLEQNKRLNSEISLARRKLFETEELYLENIRLRQLLDFKQKAVYPLTAANVIGYDPSNLSSVIIIDKGKRQEVKRGCAVITNEGLVGRVVEAGDVTSKVLLINDIDSGVAALIQRSRQKGLVCGTLAGELVLRYLPPDADLEPFDLVVTSGQSDLYPKGILIGKVIRIQDSDNCPEIFAVIQPTANLTKLEEVLIVLQD